MIEFAIKLKVTDDDYKLLKTILLNFCEDVEERKEVREILKLVKNYKFLYRSELFFIFDALGDYPDRCEKFEALYNLIGTAWSAHSSFQEKDK